MASLLLFILLVLLSISILSKQQKLSLVLGFLLLAASSSIGWGIVTSWQLKNLQIFPYQQPKLDFGKNNAIILLGGGVADVSRGVVLPSFYTYSRIVAAAETYFSCKKSRHLCTIITSGGDLKSVGKTEAHVYKDELIQLGVNPSDIKAEFRSRTTYENAKFSAPLVRSGHFDQVFLVTSGIHMRRAILSFAHFGIFAVPVASDYMKARHSLCYLGYNLNITDAALHEQLGLLKYQLFDFTDK